MKAGKLARRRKKKGGKYLWTMIPMSKKTLQVLKEKAKARNITVSRLCREILTKAVIDNCDTEKEDQKLFHNPFP